MKPQLISPTSAAWQPINYLLCVFNCTLLALENSNQTHFKNRNKGDGPLPVEFMIWARVKCSKEEMTAMLNKGLLTCPLLNSPPHKSEGFLWIFFPSEFHFSIL